MSKSISVLLSVISIISLLSCGQDSCYSKNQFVDNYNNFFQEVEDLTKEDLTDTKKKEYEMRFENMVENCYKKYKPEMSLKEKQDFWKSSLKFYIKKEGGILNLRYNSDDETDSVKKYISEEIEELVKESADDFSEVIESLLDEELPNLIDTFIGKVTEFGEEIKASLEEEK